MNGDTPVPGPRGNTYYVLRHGEAEQNVLGIVYGRDDDSYALTPAGRDQVKASVEKLSGITKIFASPIRRARETAEIAADMLGIERAKIVYDQRLRELDFGELQGKSIQEFVAYRSGHVQALSDAFPGGESYLDAKRRFGAWLYDIDSRFENESILIATHGIGIESLMSVATGMSNLEALAYVRNHTFAYAHLASFTFTPREVNGDFEPVTV